ncbi:putative NTPase (NACHT family) [Thioflavicoccus mobilis 8321]|uniref:Putative NTPase (NACHT family) n=1 Tax=Thioflavicoccus mobilis 8321 TaxID=765912 RepID=L0GYI2_9GAMM|nr:putative NTPase (NACHT family) [Thioflavicoccus mobilis 8321]
MRLWGVFVPQSVRECLSYRPQLLELPKEHQRRLLERGELDPIELAELERLHDEHRRAYFEQPLRPVLEVCADPRVPRLVLLGDPGSGKSSLLRYLALDWALTENVNARYTQPLPLLIELRDYNRWPCPSGKGFPRYLHEASTWHRLNQHTLDWLLKQPGRVVLLLDGLDEVFDPVEREQVVNDIHRFSNDYPETRILVTSRVVGYRAERLRDAGFRDYMLQDLDDKVQIPAFLERWHQVTFADPNEAASKRERLAKAIRESRSIAQLAGNPLLLTLMAIINRYQELPRDRVMLYEKAAEVLLQQWDTERGLQDFPDLSREIDLRAKTAILRRVATRMQTGDGDEGQAANVIEGEALIDLIEGYLCDELRFSQARAAAQALVRQLRERNFILCFLGADSYAFVHRTFLEYFCAADLVQRFHKEKTLTIDQLIEVFDRHARNDDWREVLRLICGQIDEAFVGRIVERLAAKVDPGRDETAALHGLPLAVYCLAEARNPARLEQIGPRVLEKALDCFDPRRSDSHEVQNALVQAAMAVGDRWPGLDGMRQSVLTHHRRISISSNAGIRWPAFLAKVLPEREHIRRLADGGQWTLRSGALITLAKSWPDVETRRLLAEHAVQDEEGWTRAAALRALAQGWPDAETRRLLADRAVQDEAGKIRRTALEALARGWPDAETRRLLVERAVQDEDGETRGVAAWLHAKQHSRFGATLLGGDLDGVGPFLDPRSPIPRDHIEEAADKVGLSSAEIDAAVASLSAHMGWDILRGNRPSPCGSD